MAACVLATLTFFAGTTAAGAAPRGGGGPSPTACVNRRNESAEKLLECMRVDGVRRHQRALQDIADANGGTRAAATPGYDASVEYVATLLRGAGYDVTTPAFSFNAFAPAGPSELQQTAPGLVTYVEDTDFGLLDQTDPGDVTAPVTPVDIQLGLGNTSTSGCEAADFAGFPAGAIALLQRGSCTFELKIENAAAAGAVGALLFNQGNADDPSRLGIPAVTFGDGNESGIPALGLTYALGAELSATPGLAMRLFANSSRVLTESVNVIADSRGGDPENTVVVGGHLDSGNEGPGINDNGSSVAGVLETALLMARPRTENRVRFAFWGAEEAGLVGSDRYVLGLSPEELDDIALYLNFDMIGSPNYVRKVYDGDGSAFGLAGPDGSGDIEALFGDFYADRDLAFEETEISFRSDYAAFFDNDIPFGGLFTGAEEIKTPEQEAIYGGTAGEQLDPCYHEACDTFDNVNLGVLDLNSDSVAFATFTYATTPGDELPGAAA
jgi:Zn-dependent M28 family amino/carboxypeptidase